MVLDFQAEASRRQRRLIIGLVVLVVVLVATVLALAFRRSGPAAAPGPASTTAQPSPVGTPAGDQSPVASSPAIPSDTNFVAPAQWVRLPKSSSTRFGVATGWEHTPEGAMAAAKTYAEASGTWDLDAADRAAQAYAPVADVETVRKDVRDRVTQSRVAVGLPASGPVPAGAHFSVTIFGVQWTPVDANTVQVAFLGRMTYTTGSTPEKTELRSAISQMIWVDGDWRNVGGPPRPVPQPAELGTSEFNASGWKALQQGSAG